MEARVTMEMVVIIFPATVLVTATGEATATVGSMALSARPGLSTGKEGTGPGLPVVKRRQSLLRTGRFSLSKGSEESMISHDWLKRTVLFGLAVVTVLLSSVNEIFAQSSNYPCWGIGPWMMGGTWGWIGGIFMMFFWILVLVAVVLLIRWLVTAGGNRTPVSHGPQTPHSSVESALDILKKRYARGEITKEQFELMRRDLE
jgi:putative membrane protein